MYPNLEAEMRRKNITKKKVAEVLDMRYATVIDKMNDKFGFKLKEAKRIRKDFFPDMSLDYLFAEEPIYPDNKEVS